MSDYQTAAEKSGVPLDGAMGEANLDLSKKQEFGDGTELQARQERELDDNLKVNQVTSPASKRKKRKNRRGQLKKDVSGDENESTGTETDLSQLSEDFKTTNSRAYGSGTENERFHTAESTLNDANSSGLGTPQQDSSFMSEPSVNTTSNVMGDRDDKNQASTGDADKNDWFSVDTLLKIAKCNTLSKVLQSVTESEDDSTMLKDSRNVHFDERPPEVVSAEAIQSEEEVQGPDESIDSEERVQAPDEPTYFKDEVAKATYSEERTEVAKEFNSEETSFPLHVKNDTSADKLQEHPQVTVLVENVKSVDSITSSLGSQTSGELLLQGNDSIEECTETSHHYPSVESVIESSEHHPATVPFNFQEAPHKFEMQNSTLSFGSEIVTLLETHLKNVPSEVDITATPSHDDTIEEADPAEVSCSPLNRLSRLVEEEEIDTDAVSNNLESGHVPVGSKQSVEVFSLHIPTDIGTASGINNDLDLGGTINDLQFSNPEYFSPATVAQSLAAQQWKEIDIETDSDFSFLPDRKRSLERAIVEREVGDDKALTHDTSNDHLAAISDVNLERSGGEDADENNRKSKCCVKMCIIT